jgi:exopolysaccharide production protein ExoZ
MSKFPFAKKTIVSVQYLRGIACLAVVTFHASGGGHGPFVIGQSGVDLFFVISGFIMWTLASGRESNPSNFIAKRLVRILPLYWFVTILIFLKRGVFPIRTATVSDLFLSLFFVPAINSQGEDTPLILQGWTLNYEMFFYALVALSLVFSRFGKVIFIIFSIALLSTAGLVFQPTGMLAQTYTSLMLLEFLGGILVAQAIQTGFAVTPTQGIVLVLIGFVIFAAEHFSVFQVSSFREVNWGIPSLLILYGSLSSEVIMPKISLLKYLGDASYAIYLVHGSIINIFSHLPISWWGQLSAGIFVSTAVGSFLHEGERNLVGFLRRLTTPPQTNTKSQQL